MAKQVTAYQGYAVFADYDGNAPDTADQLLCDTEELAKQVCDHLNTDPQKWGNLAFVEGYEWSKRFAQRVAYSEQNNFPKTFEEVMSRVEDNEE